jgi:glucuronoarabinoxylan endo-1,4-beta-xylanase
MGPLNFFVREFIAVFIFSSVPVRSMHIDLSELLESCRVTGRKFTATALSVAFFLFLVEPGSAMAQTATIDWTNVHQVIDGFGASDAPLASSMSSANQAFFFGTGPGQLGLSILRVAVPDNGGYVGNCANVSASCASPVVGDMKAVIANGGKVYGSPWSPPAIYKTNGSENCTAGSGGGAPIATDFGLYATWLANFVQSLKIEDGINLYAISVQNEPNACTDYASALWTGAQIDTFIKADLGPAFAANDLTTLIFMPEGGSYYEMTSLGSTCETDSSCIQYVGGFNWHDYDVSLTGTNTVVATPYPAGWTNGKKYWETEASCYAGATGFCQPGANTDITDALNWAAVIDQRIAVDGANAWLYWLLVCSYCSDDQALTIENGNIPALRAYVLGQYSKFVRPGYYRIDATHLPQGGVSVSAFQDMPSRTLVIVATNYTRSAVSQTFNVTNAPMFSTLIPTITSANLNLAEQSHISVSGNSFTYTLPANSITTFAGSDPIPPAPSNLSAEVVR